jgi:hypothetical protein
MRRIAWTALLLLALSTGGALAQESPAARHDVSWAASLWEAFAHLVEALFTADQVPPPPSDIMGGDCGAAMDPTGGCRG